jgi:glyceraldehyde 3-phosphate dehydrogenase
MSSKKPTSPPIKIGINGFGRIGKLVYRAILQRKSNIEVVGINDLTDTKTLAVLLKYDSTFGTLLNKVENDKDNLIVDGKKIPVTQIKNPEELPWADTGAKIIVESTGIFTKKADAEKHITAGAQKVIISAPSDDADLTVVIGVNDDQLTSEHTVISNGSCTTNSLAPPVKILHEKFGIQYGLMTTVHSYTNDQRVIDFIHKDLRRARTAAVNIIPTTTGAARSVGEVIPELKGKLNGLALRVPTPDGSITDFVALLNEEVSKEDINKALKEAAAGPLKGIMRYTEDPIVLKDIIGDSHSAIIDGDMTMVMGADTKETKKGNMIKILSWYDNEWGFSHRMVELIEKLDKL